jgi:2-isopropylmalate synthase
VDIVQRTGLPIEVGAFLGSSPIRQYTEGWTLDWLLKSTEEAVTFAVREGLRVMYVTEDTTRSDPETLRALYTCAIRAGATRICVADTVGHATPVGASAVVRFVMQLIADANVEVSVDWHGHRDRDLAVMNSIAALDAGATRIHATALGIGERIGNTPMDLLLVNLVLMGYLERDLTPLMTYCEIVSDACGVPIPDNYPVVGRDAFRTATGVHAAAVIKAWKKGDRDLMDAVYSAIPASLVGREQQIDVGPMSGKSNVIFWLERHGIPLSEPVVDRVFQRAKASTTVLTETEILAEVYR